MWKARRKYRLLYFMLVTQLRDQVPAVRDSLNKFTWGMRQLIGQVHSYEKAMQLGILPGSPTIHRSKIDEMQRLIICGLVLLNGCFPVGHLHPGGHHFVHYGDFAKTHGLLILLWMMMFERYAVLSPSLQFAITYIHYMHVHLQEQQTPQVHGEESPPSRRQYGQSHSV